MKNRTNICGEVIDLFHDKKITKLNAQLAVTKEGAPVIVLEDWSKKDKSRHLVTLHVKDALRLKAVFDCLVVDMVDHAEYIKELQE